MSSLGYLLLGFIAARVLTMGMDVTAIKNNLEKTDAEICSGVRGPVGISDGR